MFCDQLARELPPYQPLPLSPFEKLANELVITILEYLEVPTLLRCKRVSRFFSTLINETVSLQYKIELHAANLIDGPPSNRSKSARLRLLEEHQHAWNNVSWSGTQEISLKPLEDALPGVGAWELTSGLLAHAAHRTMRFTQLPSRLRDIEQRTWTFEDIGFEIRDFALDRSQDLLAIIEYLDPTTMPGTESEDVRVHLRTLSTGEPHPLAEKKTITCRMEALWHGDEDEPGPVWYVVQVYAGCVAVMVEARDFGSTSGFTSELCFWNWKSGILQTVARGPIHAFSFLTENQILLGVCRPDPGDSADSVKSDIPSLDVIDTERVSDIDVFALPSTATSAPSTLIQRCFRFPPLSSGSGTFEDALSPQISIHTDYSTTSNPLPASVPFATSSSDRLLVITLTNLVPHREPVTLFVRLSSMLSILSNTSLGPVVPWSDWGPLHTRTVFADLSFSWFCYVHGLKVVVPSKRKRLTAEIWDFNQAAVRRGRLLSSEESTITRPANVQHRYLVDPVEVNLTGVGNPSVQPRIFEEDVFTSLPCRITSFSTPDPLGSREFMMTEDSLVLVVDGNSECTILSF